MITAGGKADFDALEIQPMEICDTFDLQSHWWTEKENNQKKYVSHPMALKNIYAMYFDASNFQRVGRHTAEQDAAATMILFAEVYVFIKTTCVENRKNYFSF